ncbi:MAG: M56 family metallopeptidase [Phycisphaerales bacterium]
MLHFLWQGLVIGAIAWVALRGCGRGGAQARYGVALAALGACGLVFLVTLVSRLAAPVSVMGGMSSALSAHAEGMSTSLWSLVLRAESVSVLWCCGVGVLGVRFFRQLLAARRLSSGRADVGVPDQAWVEAFERIKARLGVHRAVRLVRHAWIDSPMVVGWFAPVVLVPAAAFASLTPDQLYAVLAHELAHIRRRDHLVNAVQAVVEVALFFHPVVWWLSSTVRVEREHCCDDVAVGAAASPLVFAEALARLETLRQVLPQAAVAANGGSLMERIERVLQVDKAPKSLRWGGAAAIAAAALVAVAALAQVSTQPGATPPAPQPAPAPSVTVEGQMLRMVVPTVLIDDDDESGVSDDQELYEVELDSPDAAPVKTFRVMIAEKLTQAEYDRLMKKEDAKRVIKSDNVLVRRVVDVKLDDRTQDLRKVMDDIEAAVDAGELSREDAEVRLADLRKQLVETKERVMFRVRLDDAATVKLNRAVEAERVELDNIEDLVAAGSLTRAEADDRIQVLRKTAAEREARMKQEAERAAKEKEAADRAGGK